jgi:hypothetical protein
VQYLIALVLVCACAVVGTSPALAAAKIKIAYTIVYDRIKPDPQKNVRVTANFDVALAESGDVKENVTRAAGKVSDGFKTGTKLGNGQWDVISEKQLQRTSDQPQSTMVMTITTIDDKSCKLDVKWALKPGFNEYKLRRITDGTMAFFTEPKVQSTTCTIQ